MRNIEFVNRGGQGPEYYFFHSNRRRFRQEIFDSKNLISQKPVDEMTRRLNDWAIFFIDITALSRRQGKEERLAQLISHLSTGPLFDQLLFCLSVLFFSDNSFLIGFLKILQFLP
jgi:hypothetical protein